VAAWAGFGFEALGAGGAADQGCGDQGSAAGSSEEPRPLSGDQLGELVLESGGIAGQSAAVGDEFAGDPCSWPRGRAQATIDPLEHAGRVTGRCA
jgi:hypothetical protein